MDTTSVSETTFQSYSQPEKIEALQRTSPLAAKIKFPKARSDDDDHEWRCGGGGGGVYVVGGMEWASAMLKLMLQPPQPPMITC